MYQTGVVISQGPGHYSPLLEGKKERTPFLEQDPTDSFAPPPLPPLPAKVLSFTTGQE